MLLGLCILSVFAREVPVDVQPNSQFYADQETFPSSEILESKEKKISESWMGVYMNGIKVGYNFNQEFSLIENGKQYTKEVDESWIRVTRLGGNPVELTTIQESLYDAQGRPLECILRTKLSESETIIKAEISQDKIVFLSEDKVIKELPYEEFFLGTPVKKIIEEKKTILVSTYPKKRARALGFYHVARSIDEALATALDEKGKDATISVIYQNNHMYPIYS